MRIIVPLIVFALGCADVPPDEPPTHQDQESRPIDDGFVEKAGVVDCRPWTDTGYVRGRSFSITVITIDGKPIEKATADAYWTMRNAAAADGVYLRIISGFRTQAEQQYLYGCYTSCSCNNCNLAAYPGYSNHQSGYALDLNTGDWGVLYWLNRNAHRFTFQRTVPSEDWHWEYMASGPGDGSACHDDRTDADPDPITADTYTVGRGGSCWDAAESLGCDVGAITNCSANRGCSRLWPGDELACGACDGSSDPTENCQTHTVPAAGTCWAASQQLGCAANKIHNCTTGSAACGVLWAGDVLSCSPSCCP